MGTVINYFNVIYFAGMRETVILNFGARLAQLFIEKAGRGRKEDLM